MNSFVEALQEELGEQGSSTAQGGGEPGAPGGPVGGDGGPGAGGPVDGDRGVEPPGEQEKKEEGDTKPSEGKQ